MSELAVVGAGIWWAGSPDSPYEHGLAMSGGHPFNVLRTVTGLVSKHYIDWAPLSSDDSDTDRAELSHWSFSWHFADDPRTMEAWPLEYIELAYGWPWRSAHALLIRDRRNRATVLNPPAVYGLALPSRQADSLGRTIWLERAIPTSPIWPGLLADAAVLTLAWAALIFGLGWVRRWNRRRRGRCIACAYDLRATPPGMPCPECGRRRWIVLGRRSRESPEPKRGLAAPVESEVLDILAERAGGARRCLRQLTQHAAESPGIGAARRLDGDSSST